MTHRPPEPADARVIARLAGVAGRFAGPRSGPPVVLSHRLGELVVRCGEVVVKAHLADADGAALAARLAAAAAPALRGMLVPPLGLDDLDGRPVSVWPAGAVLDPGSVAEPGALPWAAAGALLAGLHRTVPPVDLPPCGAPAKVLRAMRRLAASPAGTGLRARAVTAAFRTLPTALLAPTCAADRSAARSVVTHGDWHLGQLVRLPAGWRLIDVDDLGLGDPTWDLARPAAWYAADAMDPADWALLLDAYRAAGGPAVPAAGDPWPALDAPARALTVQTAALALVNSDLDVAEAFVAGCVRIARIAKPTLKRTTDRACGE